MIRLTRLNSVPVIINCDLIKVVESAPDTMLTLVNGEKILVLETPEQVVERVIAFRQAIWKGALLPLGQDGAEPTKGPQSNPADAGMGE